MHTRGRYFVYLLSAAVALCVAPSFTRAGDSPEEQRQELTRMSKETLAELYKDVPSARGAVQSAAGYGTFSNFGMKIFVVGSGMGKGVVVNNKTGKKTYMKMLQLGGGIGIGGKKFRLVFLFESGEALNTFIDSGWEFGGAAEGTVKWGDKGGALEKAISVMPGVWVYQLTDKGVALDAMVKGTKYYKDDDLN